MAFPLLKLLPTVLRTVGKVVGIDIFDKAADAITGVQLTPEQQAALEQAMLVHEREMRALSIEEMRTVMSESLAMISSSDKYVARARPTGLYIAYLCTLALVVALVAQVKIDPAAILTLMGPLFGAQGYYMHLRTKEKMNGGNGA